MSTTALGQLIQQTRQQRELRQADLAQKLGIPLATLRSYEQGLRQPRDWLGVRRIAAGLEADPTLFHAAWLSDRGIPSGRQALPAADDHASDAEYLALLLRQVLEFGRVHGRAAREGALRLAARYGWREGSALRGGDETTRSLVAGCLLVVGVSYTEDGPNPPLIGRQRLAQAAAIAQGVNQDLYCHARWRQAEQHRKAGGATADVHDDLAQSRTLLDDLLQRDAPAAYQALALSEFAKIDFANGDETAFRTHLALASGQLTISAASTPDARPSAVWPPFFGAYASLHVLDTELRGDGLWAQPTHAALNAVATRAVEVRQRAPEALSDIINHATLNYSQARLLLRAASERDRLTGFNLWWSAYSFARSKGLQSQVQTGRTIARDRAIRLPRAVVGACGCTLTRHLFPYQAQPVHYQCRECGRPLASDGASLLGKS